MSKSDSDRLWTRTVDTVRRRLLGGLVAGGGLAALGGTREARADDNPTQQAFPGVFAHHHVVYQFNKADPDYQQDVTFSVGAMLRRYQDDIKIVVVCFGPGIHVLAKKPLRPVAEEIKSRVSSLALYGVEFHACHNTMKSLDWTKDDLVDFAKVVPVGAADLMELQEKGFAYLSW
ncbi:MAG TPA: DsrE family protein [Gammaproteobacteria bacterium]|nr:DsrE family protein [Gammaproteobacteria bacterium]